MINKTKDSTKVSNDGREKIKYFKKTLESNDWIFAKTKPQNLHGYTLRKNWK